MTTLPDFPITTRWLLRNPALFPSHAERGQGFQRHLCRSDSASAKYVGWNALLRRGVAPTGGAIPWTEYWQSAVRLVAIPVLKRLMGELPASLPVPVFVVVHVGAQGRDLLANILDACGSLSVETARDAAPVEPGRVYIAPADHHLHIKLRQASPVWLDNREALIGSDIRRLQSPLKR